MLNDPRAIVSFKTKIKIVTLKLHFLLLEQRQETMDPGVVDSIFSSVVGLSKKAK